MREMRLTAKDGAPIRVVACNFERNDINGVVVISHGFGEHADAYLEVAGCLGQAGYASLIFDQRGHGKPPDDRKKWFGIIKSYQNFIDDIDVVAEAAGKLAPDVPLVLYGHSMGGNIAINALLRGTTSYTCAVLESPWLGLYKEPGSLTVSLARIFGRLSTNFTIVNKLSVSDITGDSSRKESYRADPLYHNRISLRMFTGIKDGCAYALDNAQHLTTPVFIACAARDKILRNEATHRFAAAAGDMVTIREYDSCHAIHNDVQREEYFRDIIAFLDNHCIASGDSNIIRPAQFV